MEKILVIEITGIVATKMKCIYWLYLGLEEEVINSKSSTLPKKTRVELRNMHSSECPLFSFQMIFNYIVTGTQLIKRVLSFSINIYWHIQFRFFVEIQHFEL